MTIRVFVIDESDNVATNVADEIPKGTQVDVQGTTIQTLDLIPYGHKMALWLPVLYPCCTKGDLKRWPFLLPMDRLMWVDGHLRSRRRHLHKHYIEGKILHKVC